MTSQSSGDTSFIWDLPHDLRAPSLARDSTRKALADWGLSAWADDILLIVSELVTNAVVHGAPLVYLRLWLEPGRICGAVVDHGDALPRHMDVDNDGMAEHGRGLALVTTLASSLGWGRTAGGTTRVWFTYSLPEA
jgi:Anti-sigma regulatory factor (Ser/Thr protein kinase)